MQNIKKQTIIDRNSFTNSELQITNSPKAALKYDLEERTEIFGENIIYLCKKVKVAPITRSIIDQLVKAATSTGANYIEANGAISKPDFKNKIHIALKEAKESRHWLRMLKVAVGNLPIQNEIESLSAEAQELILIFRKITQTLKKNE